MLTIVVPGVDLYDELNEEFVNTEEIVLELEHSLVSLSKWEAIHEKPFLGKEDKSTSEVISYVKAMILNPKISPEVISRLTRDNFRSINEYIDAKMSATWFTDKPGASRNREVVTAELIYYWMISFNIPMECQYWHLNRLFTLIKIFSIKNAPSKKMSRSEIAARNRELNAQRRSQLGTRG